MLTKNMGQTDRILRTIVAVVLVGVEHHVGDVLEVVVDLLVDAALVARL